MLVCAIIFSILSVQGTFSVRLLSGLRSLIIQIPQESRRVCRDRLPAAIPKMIDREESVEAVERHGAVLTLDARPARGEREMAEHLHGQALDLQRVIVDPPRAEVESLSVQV